MRNARGRKTTLSHFLPYLFCTILIKKSMIPLIFLVSRLRFSTQHTASRIIFSACLHGAMHKDLSFVQRVNKFKVIFQNLFTFASKIVKAMRRWWCSGFQHLREAILLDDCLLTFF